MLVLIWSQVLLLYQCNYPEGLFFSSGLAVEAGLRVSSFLSCGLRLRNYRAVDRGIINSAHVVFGFCVLYRRSRRLLQLGLSAYPYQERPFRTAHRINLFACYWRELETICSVLHIWSWWGEMCCHEALFNFVGSSQPRSHKVGCCFRARVHRYYYLYNIFTANMWELRCDLEKYDYWANVS